MSHVVLLSSFFSLLSFSALLFTKGSGIRYLCALSFVPHEIDQVGEVLSLVHHPCVHHGGQLPLVGLHLVLCNDALLKTRLHALHQMLEFLVHCCA